MYSFGNTNPYSMAFSEHNQTNKQKPLFLKTLHSLNINLYNKSKRQHISNIGKPQINDSQSKG